MKNNIEIFLNNSKISFTANNTQDKYILDTVPVVTLEQIQEDIWMIDIDNFDAQKLRLNTAEYDIQTLFEIISEIKKNQFQINQNMFGKYMVVNTITAGKFKIKFIN